MSRISPESTAAFAAALVARASGLFILTLIILSPEADLDEKVADVSKDMLVNYRSRSMNDHN